LGRFGLPRDDLTLERLAAWLEELPTRNALHALDLAYIEHRIGPWSSAQFYSDPSHVRFAPLLTRRGAELMLGLPSTWKVEQRMWREVVRQVWPELGEIPINSAGQGRDLLAGVQRVIDDPRIVARFIRKRLS
jgi:hypothetical protein